MLCLKGCKGVEWKCFASVVSGNSAQANTTAHPVNSTIPSSPTSPTVHPLTLIPSTINPVFRHPKTTTQATQTLSLIIHLTSSDIVLQPSLETIVLFIGRCISMLNPDIDDVSTILLPKAKWMFGVTLPQSVYHVLPVVEAETSQTQLMSPKERTLLTRLWRISFLRAWTAWTPRGSYVQLVLLLPIGLIAPDLDPNRNRKPTAHSRLNGQHSDCKWSYQIRNALRRRTQCQHGLL